MIALRSPHRRSMILCFVVAAILLAACGSPAGTAAPLAAPPAPSSQISWSLTPVSTFTAITAGPPYQLLRIGQVAGSTLPARTPKKALDLLIMGANADYATKPLNQFYADVKPFMRDVFGAANVLGPTPYGAPLNFYVTDYRYLGATPTSIDNCDPGLPAEWVPSSNVDYDGPAFNCNIALSTAAPKLNLGFIVHRGNIRDRNRYNFFSSEYNSYAAILHEMSHAAFVMSDEAPIADGRFFPAHYPNLYNGPCPTGTCAGGSCQPIGSGFHHCSTGTGGDASNLMYFDPPPIPGNNSGWTNYRYQFASIGRLNFIYTICTTSRVGC